MVMLRLLWMSSCCPAYIQLMLLFSISVISSGFVIGLGWILFCSHVFKTRWVTLICICSIVSKSTLNDVLLKFFWIDWFNRCGNVALVFARQRTLWTSCFMVVAARELLLAPNVTSLMNHLISFDFLSFYDNQVVIINPVLSFCSSFRIPTPVLLFCVGGNESCDSSICKG